MSAAEGKTVPAALRKFAGAVRAKMTTITAGEPEDQLRAPVPSRADRRFPIRSAFGPAGSLVGPHRRFGIRPALRRASAEWRRSLAPSDRQQPAGRRRDLAAPAAVRFRLDCISQNLRRLFPFLTPHKSRRYSLTIRVAALGDFHQFAKDRLPCEIGLAFWLLHGLSLLRQ